MKSLSFIFAVLVLLLSTAPNLLEGKYFEKQQNIEFSHDSHSDNDCSHCCSPFMGCSTCFGFNLPTINFSLNIIPSFSEKKIILYMDNFTSAFLTAVWQPPKNS